MPELTPDFIKEFAVFLSNEAGLHNGSIWENCMWLKGVVMRAHFFVFASFTALSFVDIKELSNDQIVEVNGEKWIISKRHKTGVPFQVKLLDIPLQIIERYKAFQENNLVFPDKHKEKQQLTSSSTFQQENRADEKRKDTPHSTSLFWGEWFDETMMNIYHLVISLLSCQLINSSDFHPPTSLRDKRMEGNATICRQVGRTSDLPAVRPADKERCIISMKRKGLPIRWYSHRLLRTEKP